MAERITIEMIENQIDRLNSKFGFKRTYIKSQARYKGIEIQWTGAYGGYKAEFSDGRDLTFGYVSKSELYYQLQAMNNVIGLYKQRVKLKAQNK